MTTPRKARSPWLKSTNRSGYRGVSWDSHHKKWRAGYKMKGKWIDLGFFNDRDEAGIAASDFRLKYEKLIELIEQEGNRSRSEKVKAHMATLTPEQKAAIKKKAHANRKALLKTNRSGFVGVSWDSKKQKWRAVLRLPNGKMRDFGYFDDVQAAARAIQEYKALHGLD